MLETKTSLNKSYILTPVDKFLVNHMFESGTALPVVYTVAVTLYYDCISVTVQVRLTDLLK